MKPNHWVGLILFSLSLAMIGMVGCVKVNVQTSPKGEVTPKALPYSEQSLIKEEISLSRFKDKDTKIDSKEATEILDYASLVAKCGEGNVDSQCAKKFTDMYKDFGCKIEFKLGNAPSTNARDAWPPTFSFSESSRGNASDDPLNCLADGVICSQNDLEAVWGLNPTNDGIKLVRHINFCENSLGTWVACAQFPWLGQAIAIRRNLEEDKNDPYARDTQLQGILWLHEFGHTKGLHHTPNALNRDPSAVMTDYVWEEQTKLNGPECFKLRGGRP